ELGHETVHHLAGPADWIEANERLEGWRDALQEAGAKIFTPLRGDWSPRSGYELGQELLARGDVSAIFAANAQMALGLLRLLHEQGRSVPGDVSIVGFDDIPEAEFFMPPLTTVRQDFSEMGRRGLRQLLSEIDSGERSLERVSVPAALVER